MRHSIALVNLAKDIPPIDDCQKMDFLHVHFTGTVLFGGDLAKLEKANKERASVLTLFPNLASPSTSYYPGQR